MVRLVFNTLFMFWLAAPLCALDEKALLQQIADRQNYLFMTFLPATNFENYPHIKQAIDQDFPDRSRQFDNDLMLVIFAPSDIRNKIIQEGFKNQFETNTSQGLLDKNARFNTERSLLGYSSREYKDIPLSIRPKYGLVTTKKHLLKMIENVSHYGDDIYIIKNKTGTTITWTPGDSLNRVYKKQSDYITNCAGWDEIFIPWHYRHIIIPYLRDKNPDSILVPSSDTIKPKNKLNPIAGSNTNSEYMEFQLWGSAPLSVAKTLIHTKKKVTKKQKIALMEAKVSIKSLENYKKGL